MSGRHVTRHRGDDQWSIVNVPLTSYWNSRPRDPVESRRHPYLRGRFGRNALALTQSQRSQQAWTCAPGRSLARSRRCPRCRRRVGGSLPDRIPPTATATHPGGPRDRHAYGTRPETNGCLPCARDRGADGISAHRHGEAVVVATDRRPVRFRPPRNRGTARRRSSLSSCRLCPSNASTRAVDYRAVAGRYPNRGERAVSSPMRAAARRLPGTSSGPACASPGRCSRPATRGETPERVANRSSRSG